MPIIATMAIDRTKIEKQIEALEDAIASGALKVKYADREVGYRSMTEMIQALDLLKKKLGSKGGITFVQAIYDGGR